jgi:hypothetical protein
LYIFAIEDTNALVWSLSGLRWMGCALLKKANAACADISIALAAAWGRAA